MSAIFFVALAVRLVHFSQIRDFVFVQSLVVDSREYDAWARRIAGGSWLSSEVFYQAPLYPYFMAAVYSMRPEASAVRLVQALLGSALYPPGAAYGVGRSRHTVFCRCKMGLL